MKLLPPYVLNIMEKLNSIVQQLGDILDSFELVRGYQR